MRAFSTATESCPARVASSAWSYSDPLSVARDADEARPDGP